MITASGKLNIQRGTHGLRAQYAGEAVRDSGSVYGKSSSAEIMAQTENTDRLVLRKETEECDKIEIDSTPSTQDSGVGLCDKIPWLHPLAGIGYLDNECEFCCQRNQMVPNQDGKRASIKARLGLVSNFEISQPRCKRKFSLLALGQ